MDVANFHLHTHIIKGSSNGHRNLPNHTNQWSELTESQISMFKVQSGPIRRSLVAFSTRTVAETEDDDDITPNPSRNKQEAKQNELQQQKSSNLFPRANSNQRTPVDSASWFLPLTQSKSRRKSKEQIYKEITTSNEIPWRDRSSPRIA